MDAQHQQNAYKQQLRYHYPYVASVVQFYLDYQNTSENSWKYYNSYRIILNIGTPKVITNKVTSLVEDTKIRQAVSMFISNLLSLKPKFTLSYSRSDKTLPKTYNKRGITSGKLKQAVDWLVTNGYALEQRGKATPDLEARFSSYLWPTEKLTTMFVSLCLR